MIVTKGPIPQRKQRPTSTYLNSETQQQTTNISLKLNEEIFAVPTNPHLHKYWNIKVDNNTFFYSSPENIFQDTGLHSYFKNILYHTYLTSGIIEHKDTSNYRYGKLFKKLAHLNKIGINLPEQQKMAAIEILRQIAINSYIPVNEIKIDFNADGELVVFKKSVEGKHYVLIGDDITDLSYVYISNIPGIYFSRHLGGNISVSDIVDPLSTD
jgi:hypothetical protein